MVGIVLLVFLIIFGGVIAVRRFKPKWKFFFGIALVTLSLICAYYLFVLVFDRVANVLVFFVLLFLAIGSGLFFCWRRL